MTQAYVLAKSIHTSRGYGVDANIAALHLPPLTPARIDVRYADQQAKVPYQLLSDTPLELGESRLRTVVDKVIAAALEQAELNPVEQRDMALFIGSSSFDISVAEVLYQRAVALDDNAVPLLDHGSIGNLAFTICQQFGLRGPDYSINTACTASANALMQAATMIRTDRVQHALVMGMEFFNTITALGFHGLELLTRGAMKPFDRQRDGLALGESCAAIVLGAKPRTRNNFYLRGAANMCDRHSISAANPDGSTVAEVMQKALHAAALTPAAIAAIKTHGTASLLNDEAEVAGMRRVFAQLPPLCALKPHIGHTLGACGIGEAVLMLGAIESGFIGGSIGVCADESDLGIKLIQQPLPTEPGNFMLNYFGFGGSNTSLIFSDAGNQ